MLLLAALAVIHPVSPAPAEEPAGAASVADKDSTGRVIVASIGSVLGSIVYAPFKAVILCPGMALAGGVTYAVTLGDAKDDAEYLARVGCTGTYLINREMIQGDEGFQGSGVR
jgi:hypothetical protein